MNALDRLISYQNKTTEQDTYHQIVKIILKNIQSMKSSTIYDIADMCYTSTASIGRLCKILGYSGYAEFHIRLMEVLEHYDYYNNPIPSKQVKEVSQLKENFHDILEKQTSWLDQMQDDWLITICEVLHTHNDIFYLSYGSSPEFVRVLSINLTMSGKYFHYYGTEAELNNSLSKLSAQDIFIFSFPIMEQTTDLLSLYNRMKDMNYTCFLITTSPYYSKVDLEINKNQYHLKFPGFASSLDALPIQTLWNMIAVLYRSLYMA